MSDPSEGMREVGGAWVSTTGALNVRAAGESESVYVEFDVSHRTHERDDGIVLYAKGWQVIWHALRHAEAIGNAFAVSSHCRRLSGVALVGKAKVQMTTTDIMAADARGLTHGGFYFGNLSGSLQPYCCLGLLNRSVCPCPSRIRAPVFRAPRSASSPLSAPAPFGRALPPPRSYLLIY
eukprot:1191277-Prorocentrum_minimum.AAC.6